VNSKSFNAAGTSLTETTDTIP